MQSEAAGLPNYAMQFRIRCVDITHYAVVYRDTISRLFEPGGGELFESEQCAARELRMSHVNSSQYRQVYINTCLLI